MISASVSSGRNREWSIGALLTKLEEYNGLGYASRGVASPYVWAGTDQYRSGKYVRDGVYDPDVIDSQAGCAGLLMAMKALDPSIAFPVTAQPANTKEASLASQKKAAATPPAKTPPFKVPAFASLVAGIASALFSLFAVFKPKGK